MGTNFYMFTSNKELKPYFGENAVLVDEPDFGYEIHIAKTSGGWQPCFQAHEHIRSVVDLKLLYDTGGVKIYDEYGNEYDWPGFVERVVEFGSKQNWRTHRNNDCPPLCYDPADYEFTSVDGYRFSTREFS